MKVSTQEMTTTSNKSNPTAENQKKVLILVVFFKSQKLIESIIGRMPKEVLESKNFITEILAIDDQSSEQTTYSVEDSTNQRPEIKINVLHNPQSQGYGGNQKIGYCYAIKKGFDAVVLLHGEGKYAPEYLDQMIQPILDGEADAVFGSRMLKRLDALKGRMPLYKWIGNQVITFLQNRIMKSRLSEFHSGYRAYSVPALASIPFERNSIYFDFDTDIIFQLLDTNKRIKEISIPTFHGNEISCINCTRYAIRVFYTCILYTITRLGIFDHPKFDYESSTTCQYEGKLGYTSSHQFALARVSPGATVLDIGCGSGLMATHLADKNVKTISIDRTIEEETKQKSWKWLEVDLEQYDFEDDFGKVDYILLLDIIEHLKSHEHLLRLLRARFSRFFPEVVITTGNIGFIFIRLGLLLGIFNYGRRGILDKDHCRLFTFSALRRTLKLAGYEIISTSGIPAPYPLAIGDNWLSRFLLLVNRSLIFISKGLFSYQIAIIAKPLPTLEHLLEDAHEDKKQNSSKSTLPEG